MTGSSILLFCITLGIACGTPGPTTMALVSRVVARGMSGIGYFCAGLLFGDLFWLLCATLGFATLIAATGPLFTVVRLLGAAYLFYLAWRLWTSPMVAGEGASIIQGDRTQLGIAGLLVALGNPKTMLFYLALVPALLPVGEIATLDVLTLSVLVLAIYGMVLGLYAVLSSQARRFLQSPGALRGINKFSGTVIAATAAFIALQ